MLPHANDSNIFQDHLKSIETPEFNPNPNALIACDIDQINELYSQIAENPFESILQLLKISEQQYISISNEALSSIFALLSDSFSQEDKDTLQLREYIYQLLINSIGESDAYIELLSNPTYLSLLLKDFPQNHSCAQLLTKIVDRNPQAAQYIFEHEIDEKTFASMLNTFKDDQIIDSELIFFSKALSKLPENNESLMNLFSQFVFSVITSSIENGNENLLEDTKDSLKNLIEASSEFAQASIQFLPILCTYDEIDDDMNMSTIEILEAIAIKLGSYEPLFATSPGVVASFILQNFDITRCNDFSVFSVLKFLVALDDLSPLVAVECEIDFSRALISNLVERIQRCEKFDISKIAVIALCHLLKWECAQTIVDFVQNVDFGIIFKFSEIEDKELSCAILETTIKIDETLLSQNPSETGMSEFLQMLSENENFVSFISNQLESEDEKNAQYANYIFEKISQ